MYFDSHAPARLTYSEMDDCDGQAKSETEASENVPEDKSLILKTTATKPEVDFEATDVRPREDSDGEDELGYETPSSGGSNVEDEYFAWLDKVQEEEDQQEYQELMAEHATSLKPISFEVVQKKDLEDFREQISREMREEVENLVARFKVQNVLESTDNINGQQVALEQKLVSGLSASILPEKIADISEELESAEQKSKEDLVDRQFEDLTNQFQNLAAEVANKFVASQKELEELKNDLRSKFPEKEPTNLDSDFVDSGHPSGSDLDQLQKEVAQLNATIESMNVMRENEMEAMTQKMSLIEDKFSTHAMEVNSRLDAMQEKLNSMIQNSQPNMANVKEIISNVLESSLRDFRSEIRSEIGDTSAKRKTQVIRDDPLERQDGGTPSTSGETTSIAKSADQSEAGTNQNENRKPKKSFYPRKRRYYPSKNNTKQNSNDTRNCGFHLEGHGGGGKVTNNSMTTVSNAKEKPNTNEDDSVTNLSLKLHGIRKERNVTHIQSTDFKNEASEEQRCQSQDQTDEDIASKNGTLSWRIDDFQKKFDEARSKDGATYVMSKPFYTSEESGHMMRVILSMNGDGVADGNHMSIFLEFMADRDQKTPLFDHVVTYTLIDQSCADHHPSIGRPVVRSYEPLFGCDQMERVEEIWGPNLFVPHGLLLGERRGDYVRDDVIQVQVTVEPITKLFSDNHFSNNGILTWRISDYFRHKRDEQDGIVHYLESEPFYNSVSGYRMKALLFLNGLGEGEGSHASIFLGFFKGKFDAELTGPLTPHKVEFILRSQVANFASKDIVEIEVFNPDADEHDQASRQRLNKLSGKSKFVAHSLLESEPYLMRDEIVVQVNVKPLVTGTNVSYN